MKFFCRHFLFSLLFAAFCQQANATHYRAGEILYQLIGNYQYRVTIITYSKADGISLEADRDMVRISWGDGTSDSICRTNGPPSPNGNGCQAGILLTSSPSIKKNEYTTTHTYPGPPP